MNININKPKIRNSKILFLLILSLFVFSQELRSRLGQQMYTVNILSTISIILLLLNNIKSTNLKGIILFYITIIIYVSTSSFYEKSIITIFTTIIILILPVALILIRIEKATLEYLFKITIVTINMIIFIITLIGIFEIIFDFNINVFISNFMSQRTQEQIIANSMIINGKRLYSFMGHPLFNTELYLIFFVLNILYNKYLKKQMCPLWILIISVIGIGFTGSKTGFVLLIAGIIMLFKLNSKKQKILVILIGAFISFKIGIFNTIIDRLSTGSLTSGRGEKWIEINSLNIYPIKFFTGYGRGFTFQLNSYVDWASAAFEYPIRMISLEYGVLMAIIIYVFIMIIPIAILLRRKQYYLFISYLLVFLDVNTFNGLVTSGDKMIIFCLFIFLILNLSNALYIEKYTDKIQSY